jgi:hypothetical protein
MRFILGPILFWFFIFSNHFFYLNLVFTLQILKYNILSVNLRDSFFDNDFINESYLWNTKRK